MTTATGDRALSYDPYDFAIHADPYPVWKRMRDEAPLYYNEKYAFYALTRFDDVEQTLIDWDTYRSGKGTVLELIKSGSTIAPGMVLFEDPPIHDLHRALLSRVFTPKKVSALEPQVREFCARSLDRHVGAGGFDFVRDLAAFMPMRVIGMLLGIPEEHQEAIRDAGFERRHLKEGQEGMVYGRDDPSAVFADYVDWRVDHPSDDLMTELLNVEFEDETGTNRKLTRTEVLTYTNMLASAGNETTQRLIGWTGKVLGEHPDQRREVAADRSLVPNTIEEMLRFETPSPVNARVTIRDTEHYGQTVPAGSVVVLLNGAANRDERRFPEADSFDLHRRIGHHLSFGYGLHFCMGAALARQEGRIALDEVLNRWTDWEVDSDNAVLDHTSTTRGWHSLPVVTS
jgi:cytochrome P450